MVELTGVSTGNTDEGTGNKYVNRQGSSDDWKWREGLEMDGEQQAGQFSNDQK